MWKHLRGAGQISIMFLFLLNSMFTTFCLQSGGVRFGYFGILKYKCHIIKNTLPQTAFSAILQTGFDQTFFVTD